MFFESKNADVRIWKNPLSTICPHWTNFLPPDYGRLLWTLESPLFFIWFHPV